MSHATDTSPSHLVYAKASRAVAAWLATQDLGFEAQIVCGIDDRVRSIPEILVECVTAERVAAKIVQSAVWNAKVSVRIATNADDTPVSDHIEWAGRVSNLLAQGIDGHLNTMIDNFTCYGFYLTAQGFSTEDRSHVTTLEFEMLCSGYTVPANL